MMPLVEPPELEPIFAKARARIDATGIAADYVWAVGQPGRQDRRDGARPRRPHRRAGRAPPRLLRPAVRHGRRGRGRARARHGRRRRRLSRREPPGARRRCSPVQITRVRAFRQLQPFRRGNYAMGHVGSAQFDSTIVVLDTDEGVTGFGEMAVISAAYADSFAEGARAGVADLSPVLLGLDPTQPRVVLAALDAAMRGQPYVKSALDMACWDITAKLAGRPLCETLGARFGESVPLYNVVTVLPLDEAVDSRARARRRGISTAPGQGRPDPEQDAERLAAVRDAVGPDIVLFADANGAFTPGGARRFLRATRDTRVHARTALPHLRRVRLGAARERPAARARRVDRDASTISCAPTATALPTASRSKLQRVGGITRAMLIRDVAVELGVEVTVEDAGGASLVTAAVVHVGLGTPERLRVHTCDFHTWVSVDHGTGLPPRADGGQMTTLRRGARDRGRSRRARGSNRRRLDVGTRHRDGCPERAARPAGTQRGCSRSATAGEAIAALPLARESVPADRDPQCRPGRAAPLGGAHDPRGARHPGATARGPRRLPERRRRGRRGDGARAVRAGARRAIARPGSGIVRAGRPCARAHRHARRTPPRHRARQRARPQSATSTAANGRATSPTSAISFG